MRSISTALAAGALLACSCGGQSVVGDAADASIDAAEASIEAPPSPEAGKDGAGIIGDGGGDTDAGTPDCTYDDGGSVFDGGGRFRGTCSAGCPAGTVCAVEIGGVAGGGGEYCAPIVDRCKNDVSCACLASCLCGSSFGRAERCTDGKADGGEILSCDNGIRQPEGFVARGRRVPTTPVRLRRTCSKRSDDPLDGRRPRHALVDAVDAALHAEVRASDARRFHVAWASPAGPPG